MRISCSGFALIVIEPEKVESPWDDVFLNCYDLVPLLFQVFTEAIFGGSFMFWLVFRQGVQGNGASSWEYVEEPSTFPSSLEPDPFKRRSKSISNVGRLFLSMLCLLCSYLYS